MNSKSTNPNAVAELESLVNTRSTIGIGLGVLALFFLVFLIWGSSVPLSTAAIAQGVVGVEGHKKLVQHLDGGIISKIHVGEGDIVRAGQELVTLNDVEINSRYQEIENHYIKSSAEYARLTAEQNNLPLVNYPSWLEENSNRALVTSVIAAQNDIHNARIAVLEGARKNVELQLSRASEELRAAKSRINKLNRKQELVNAEMVEYERLEKQGLVTRTRRFELQKELTNLDLDISETASVINLSEQRSAQLSSQLNELESTHRQEAVEKRTDVGALIESLKQQLTILSSERERSTIEASIDGYIVNSIVNTVGGIVSAGQVLMEIVPTEERLLIESRVDARDRDSVRLGQSAEVRFTAFSKRSTLPVKGVVKLISADSVFDATTQSAYYSVTVELVEDPSEILNGASIFPGMQADLIIVTGSQTFMQYLTAPITRSFNRAFREE